MLTAVTRPTEGTIGRGYRDLWTSPIEVEVLNMQFMMARSEVGTTIEQRHSVYVQAGFAF